MSLKCIAKSKRAGSFTIEPLEPRQLMTFVPIIAASALTADNSTYNVPQTDANLTNPWGLTVAPNGQLFVADNLAAKISSYSVSGVPQSNVATIPATLGVAPTPTGIVTHNGKGFNITVNGAEVSSQYIVATENGTIAGYAPAAGAASANIEVDHSGTGDVFTGLAITGGGTGAKIFAADFHNARVEVFNSSFQQVSLKSTAFKDSLVPTGYAPFGITTISGNLYVSYARQDAAAKIDNPGPAQGIIDVYSPAGRLIHRFSTGGDLNSPWGMVVAPASWGVFRGDLLVSNFGDGTISIFSQKNKLITADANFVEQVPDPNAGGIPLSITNLWGLAVGTGKAKNTVFFTSAPNSQADGILGSLVATKPAHLKK